jgi:CheY-like chemotaxis protein
MTNRVLKNILYVDDDPDLRKIVQLSLEYMDGVTVLTCDSGEQALQFVKGFRPDLIILDVVMEGMDGTETLAELRKLPEAAEIPVVFLTSSVRENEMPRYEEMGAAGIIRKPIHPRKLPTQLMKLWEKL